MAFTPDARLLITTQFGALRVVEHGTLSPTAVVDLGPRLCTANEMGLLGVAVDPAFAGNGYVYLYSSRDIGGECVNRVSRYTMSGNTIAESSELVLVDGIPATSGNHNGGDLKFGRDGYLYVSVGDAGCDYAGGGCYGQNDASRDQHALVGKILRITSTGGVPPDNPFVGAGTARCNVTGRTTAGTKCQETFAWGLRNPFRIAFDPNAPGTSFFINDVGDGAWEEVNAGLAGADYGWNVREGPCENGEQTGCGPQPAGMTNPAYAYRHDESSCHAITGGAFVPNGIWPSVYDGTYLYGDYTCGKIFQLSPSGGGYTRTEFATDVGAVVNLAFGPGPQGPALYYTNYSNGGEVRRIEPTVVPNRPPTARVTATPSSGAVPLAVSFDGSTSSDPDSGDTLTYTWDFGDGSPAVTTTGPTTAHTYTTAGSFTSSLMVRDNHGTASPAASARIDPGNTAPQVTIDSPTAAQRFAVGQTITLHATATDAQDGALPPSSLSWRVLRHHDTHTHPFLAPTPGNDLTIQQPAPEDLGSGADGYLEILLTATDSSGVTTTVTRDVLPKKVSLTFASSPTGRNLVVAGTTYAAPVTLTSWEGHTINVDAPAQTDGSGTSWVFQSWSDGGAAAHSLATPTAATTYTATFAQNATPVGLVAAYGFDAGSGSGAADSSGRGNAGTVSGAAWSAAGRFGSALSFDGVNDWVTVPDSSSLDLSSGMTLEAWVRPSKLGKWRTVVCKERPGGIVYGMFGDQGAARPLGQVEIGGERNAVGTSALPLNAWSHLATTFDGAVVRLFVNGVQAGSLSISGSMAASTGVFRIGGNGIWSEWFAGSIDEVRVYNRALSATEIQQDMQRPVSGPVPPPPPDTAPPAAPSGLTSSTAVGSATLNWTASTDNVGVVRYNVHRSTTAGFTPATANRIGQPTATSYVDSGLAAGTYYYRVTAEDAAGNVSAPTAALAVNVPAPDTTPPSAPSGLTASTAVGSATVSWTAATDNVGVARYNVHRSTTAGFTPAAANRVGQPTGTSHTDSGLAAGTYYYRVTAEDAAGNVSAPSAQLTATVPPPQQPPPPAGGLVAAYALNSSSGSSVADSSGRGNAGTVSGAAWSAAGRFGSALSFDGVNDWVTVADSASLDLSSGMTVEAWVRPSKAGGWRTVVIKERPGGVVYGLYGDQGGARPLGQVEIGTERNAVGSSALPLNAWSHLATTYDGAVVRLFVNGVQAGSLPFSGSMAASTGALRLGGNGVWGEWFAGLIDEVRVYNRALTASEIQQDMQTPVG